MLLDRIDIDNHGPLNRVELGPFSEYLNVVCTPVGSGKTAIARFVRDSLIRREYPLGMMSSSAGRVVWADRNGKIHCRREHDGTASGRRTIEFESRGDAAHRFDWLQGCWIDGIADSTDASRALESIRIPESIVDGIVTDTAVTSVSRVIQSCVQSGLNDPALFAGLPINRSSVSGTSPTESAAQNAARRSIRDELARLEAELATLDHLSVPADTVHPTETLYDHDRYAAIQSRQNVLKIRLASLQSIQRNRTTLSQTQSVAVQTEIDSILAELRMFDRTPTLPSANALLSANAPRIQWLVNRRAELIESLGVAQPARHSGMPLADEASQWLVRLSGGRLRRVDWNPDDFTTAPKQMVAASRNGFAKIDGRDESACSAIDRALAALALRLAAGDLLARTDRAVPLVIEAHRELLQSTPHHDGADPTSLARRAGDNIAPTNLSVIAALDDYAKSGHQVIVLASDPMFADQIARRGGQVTTIHSERVAHEHRPLWQPHFASEAYAGPHAGSRLQSAGVDPLLHTDASIDHYYDEYFDNVAAGATLADINRNLDVVWQEAYGISPYASATPAKSRTAQQPSVANAQHWHDGYYFADSYTTAPPVTAPPTDRRQIDSVASTQSQTNHNGTVAADPSTQRPPSPFFLSVDSPIDQAPSVDAVAASRLRGLNVTHINHLMNQDPNRLSDSLGLAGVTAATIRRWQSECRLVCHVPQLRGFDARILVGCGIVDASRLAATDPMGLLDRVEAFLATERGQRILLSGTSYELSRITSWIATANVHTDDNPVIRMRDHQTPARRLARNSNEQDSAQDSDRYEYEFIDDNGDIVRARSNRQRSHRRTDGDQNGRNQRPINGETVRSGGRNTNRAPTRRERSAQENHSQRESNAHQSGEGEYRFYLQRESPVVDAPSIGTRMETKLEAIGIVTVADLLNSDADELANRLDQRRIDADVITSWQNQAILVCRIPMLRGHDAQLLVAAEISTPEEVAEYEPEELFALIDPIARSNEGKRILRGGKLPDVQEITEWINYASQNRELIAA